RSNPHKVSLLRFYLVDPSTGQAPRAEEITGARQQLDLWTGTISSSFRFRGRECRVVTTAGPEQAVLALQLTTPGLDLGLEFLYGTRAWHRTADWARTDAHTTRFEGGWIRRRMDDLSYDVEVSGAVPEQLGPHRAALPVPEPGGLLDVALTLVPRRAPQLSLPAGAAASPAAGPAPSRSADGPGAAAVVRERSARFWAEHWQTTAAIDLGAADDPRAEELERRTVLSRYLQRAHAAGHLPPAENGLLANSWRGKFHLEMHWWYAAHFALWGVGASLRRGLAFYTAALPLARETAARQGCLGARWPTQIGADLRESPSDIGPFLIWQQPHPIHLAELARRAQADPQHVDPASAEIVEQSALFLVDSLRWDEGRLGIGPPVIGAQERHVGDRAHLRGSHRRRAADRPGSPLPAPHDRRRHPVHLPGRPGGVALGPSPPSAGLRDGGARHGHDPAAGGLGRAGRCPGRLGLGEHLGLGLPGAGDDRCAAAAPGHRGGGAAASDHEEPRRCRRALRADPAASRLPSRQRRHPDRSGADDGRMGQRTARARAARSVRRAP